MLKFSLNKQTNKPKKKKKVRLEHPQQMCQVPNIWHTKHKKHLPSNVLYVPNFYHLCPYYCKFATVRTQMPNRKILFYSTFLSPLISLFDFFSLFLESVSLSPKFPTHVLPLLTIGCKQEEGGGGGQERRKGSYDFVKIDDGSHDVESIDGGKWVCWVLHGGD